MKSAIVILLLATVVPVKAQRADSIRTFKATLSVGIGYIVPLAQNLSASFNANWEVYVRLRGAYSLALRGLMARDFADNRYPVLVRNVGRFSSEDDVRHRYQYTALMVGKAIPLSYKRGADFDVSVGLAWVRYQGADNVSVKTRPAYVDKTGFLSFPASDYYSYEVIGRHVPGLAVSAGVQAPWWRVVGNRLGVVACLSPALSSVNFTWGITLGKAR